MQLTIKFWDLLNCYIVEWWLEEKLGSSALLSSSGGVQVCSRRLLPSHNQNHDGDGSGIQTKNRSIMVTFTFFLSGGFTVNTCIGNCSGCWNNNKLRLSPNLRRLEDIAFTRELSQMDKLIVSGLLPTGKVVNTSLQLIHVEVDVFFDVDCKIVLCSFWM